MKLAGRLGRISREQGVALGVVVWFIAGMALVVSGIVSEARVDAQMAQLHYFRAQVAAAGDGAIHLALAEQRGLRVSGQRGLNRLQNYQVGPHLVEIRMIPGGLFVNISTADQQTLQALFAAGALEAEQRGVPWDRSPSALAAGVLEFRDGRGRQRGRQFFSPEDLLRVPGVTRGVYDAVRDFIAVDDLAEGFQERNVPVVARLKQLQAAMVGEGDLTKGAAQHAARSLRIDAIVTVGDQQWIRRRWVTLATGGFSQLPWQIVRTEAARPLAVQG